MPITRNTLYIRFKQKWGCSCSFDMCWQASPGTQFACKKEEWSIIFFHKGAMRVVVDRYRWTTNVSAWYSDIGRWFIKKYAWLKRCKLYEAFWAFFFGFQSVWCGFNSQLDRDFLYSEYFDGFVTVYPVRKWVCPLRVKWNKPFVFLLFI